MKLTDLYNEVSRRSDTKGTKINVSETKRVLSELFCVLSELPTDEAVSVIASGMKRNRIKNSK